MRMIPLDALLTLLDGIDRCELDADNGWWETESGSEFGEKILEQIKLNCVEVDNA